MVHAGAAPLSEEEISGLLATIETERLRAGRGPAHHAGPARGLLRRHHRACPRSAAGCAWWWTRATASRECSPPSCCAGSAARSSSSTASRTAPSPTTCPIPRWRRTSGTSWPRCGRRAPTSASPTTATPTAWASSTSKGRRHEADLILALLARDLLTRHPGDARSCSTSSRSQVLVDDIRKHGGVPVMWKTGHSHLKRKMREDGILLGGRGVRPHVLRRELVRRGRRHPRLLQVPRAGGRARRRPVSAHFDTPAPSASPLPSSRRPAPTTRSSRWSTSSRGSSSSATRRSTSTGCASLSRRLGARARVEHQPLPHPALRGQDRRGARGHEADGLRRPPPLPGRDAARLAHVAGMPERVAAGLGPDGEAMRLLARRDASSPRPRWYRSRRPRRRSGRTARAACRRR